MVERLAKAGRPLRVVTVISDAGLADKIKRLSPDTFVIFRFVWGKDDPSPAALGWPTGEWWWERMWAVNSQCLLADVYQCCNEWLTNDWSPADVARFVKFYMELMQAAKKRGKKVTVGDFFPGTPEVLDVNGFNQLEAMAPMFDMAAELGMPINAHMYNLDENTMSDPEQWTGERFVRYVMRYPNCKFVFGEDGTFKGDYYPDRTPRLMQERAVQIANYPQVIGSAWWTLRGSVLNGWADDNINPVLPWMEQWIKGEASVPDDDGVEPIPTPVIDYWGRGVHLAAGGWWMDEQQRDLASRSNVKAGLVVGYEPQHAGTVMQSMKAAGITKAVFRYVPEKDNGVDYIQRYQAAWDQPLHIALHNEPNLVNEGLGSRWKDGKEFALWFVAQYTRLKQINPQWKIGFPALSPGGDVPGLRRAYSTFLAEAKMAVQRADWIGVHYYWTKSDGSDINPPFAAWERDYPGKLIMGTEIGPADLTTVVATPQAYAKAYDLFWRRRITMFAWLLDGSGAWKNAAWTTNNIVVPL